MQEGIILEKFQIKLNQILPKDEVIAQYRLLDDEKQKTYVIKMPISGKVKFYYGCKLDK